LYHVHVFVCVCVRLEWAGNICRMGVSRTPKKILEGKIYGSQSVVKKKGRRTDEVTRDARILVETVGWKRKALDWKVG